MEKKITMIDYQGRHDLSGKAIGHSVKVLQEYYNELKEIFRFEIFVPQVIKKEVKIGKSDNIVILHEAILMKRNVSLFEKVVNKKKMFDNIYYSIKHASSDVLWFYNVEFYFYLFITFWLHMDKHLVCTVCKTNYGNEKYGKLKQFIFEKAQKKISLILKSDNSFEIKNCESIFVPDYFYEEKYVKYSEVEKKEKVVCLGTMNSGKMLEEIVNIFNENRYPLEICGCFYDESRYVNLKRKANQNIIIENRYLCEEEYYDKLASAKYVILPYSEKTYLYQTSGILQESLFVGSIPITYDSILKKNGIPGVGIEEFNELANYSFDDDICIYREKIQRILYEKYEKNNIIMKICNAFEKI